MIYQEINFPRMVIWHIIPMVYILSLLLKVAQMRWLGVISFCEGRGDFHRWKRSQSGYIARKGNDGEMALV